MDKQMTLRMQYAGAIALLCECAVHLGGIEAEDMRESIERAVDDWCKLTGWTWTRTLNRLDLHAPLPPT